MLGKDLCNIHSLKLLIKVPASYKNPNKLKCINLMLIYRLRSFQNSNILETGLSDLQ